MPHRTNHSHHSGHSHSHHSSHAGHGHGQKRSATFSKVFRWHPAKPGDPEPGTVEIAGSFTGWKKMPLVHEKTTKGWHLTLHDIPGNRTHNYMLFVDGHPASDKNSDGMAIPHSDEEKQHALTTVRGPRVFMLFSQTK